MHGIYLALCSYVICAVLVSNKYPADNKVYNTFVLYALICVAKDLFPSN